VTYELINAVTTNTLASFHTRAAAERALDDLGEENAELARVVEIVAFDDDGMALEEEEAEPVGHAGELPEPGNQQGLISRILGRERERV